jgi:glyoxylase I family protein
MANGIRHVGLVVSDPERALSFYRDILGFVVEKDQLESGPFVETILGLKGLKVRTIKMRLGEGTLLELLHFESRSSSAGMKDIQDKGFSHIALNVQNADVLFNRLKGQGISFISAPVVSADGKAKVAFCRDPEGNFLELVEELT